MSVRSISRLAGVVVAALVLSACGAAFQQPAAVVGGTEITQGQLQHQLDLLLRQPQFAQQVRGALGTERKHDFTRQLLALLIEQDVVARYAAANDIAVPPSEIEQSLDSVIQQQGGQEGFEAALKQFGLTEADVRDNIYRSLLRDKVRQAVSEARFGPNASQEQQAAAFDQWRAQQYRAVGVEVNPRFGRLDLTKGTICPIDSTAATTTCPA